MTISAFMTASSVMAARLSNAANWMDALQVLASCQLVLLRSLAARLLAMTSNVMTSSAASWEELLLSLRMAPTLLSEGAGV
eukprot:scaffold120972_cov17-Tisochrysis_lutea.AAC.1